MKCMCVQNTPKNKKFDVLKLDYDSKEYPMPRLLRMLSELQVPYKKIRLYSTAKGYHAYITTVCYYSQVELLLLQVLLRSDLAREYYNYMRLINMGECNNILFSHKYYYEGNKLSLISEEKLCEVVINEVAL